MGNFKVGDRVKMNPHSEYRRQGFNKTTPYQGTIIFKGKDNSMLPFKVRWDQTGSRYFYPQKDLLLISESLDQLYPIY